MTPGGPLLAALALGSQAAGAGSTFPNLIFARPEPVPLHAVPLSKAREELRTVYRVKLDRRLVGAVGEIYRLASGAPVGTVVASVGPRGWVLQHGTDTVGTVPELPGFRDGEQVLNAWAAALLRRYPLASGSPAARDGDGLALPVLAERLRTIDRAWASGRNAALLADGARALTLLAIQTPRQSEVADPLNARAIAAVLLAAAAGQDVGRERVLLAHHLGYTADAAAMGSVLAADDPVRLFARADTLALRRAAEAASAGPLVRYLYLMKLVDTGRPGLWKAWQRRQSFEPDFHSGVLGAAMDFHESSVDRDLSELMPQQLFLEAARLDVPDAALDTTNGWHSLFAYSAAGSRHGRLARFESDLERVGRGFSGPFLDSSALMAYFRAQLQTAFERRCEFEIGRDATFPRLGPSRESTPPPDGLWNHTARWCRHRAEVPAGLDTVAALLTAVEAPPSTLSEPALAETLDDLQDHLRYSDSTDLLVARRYFQRLDSRPSHLYRAGIIAEDLLYDAPLKERYYQRLLELAPSNHSYLRVWWARYREDVTTLRVLARDAGLPLDDRQFAIRALRSVGDSAAAGAAFTQLIAERPADWPARREFIQMLEASGRYAEAAAVARAWLGSYARRSGADRVSASTALARQLQRLGRPAEGWQLLEPLLRMNSQQGLWQRAALIAKDLGEIAKAESLATQNLRRYPTSEFARIALAEVLWAQQRDAEVPAVLDNAEAQLPLAEWRDPIAPIFVGIFGRVPIERGLAAFQPLGAAGIPREKLETIVRIASDSGRYELAVTLRQQLPEPESETDQIEAWVEAYRVWRRWKGEAAAFDWLRQRWPWGARVGPAVVFYREQAFDLLWTVTTQPDQGAEGSYLWLLRALAAVQQPVSAERRAQLLSHYRTPSDQFYDIAGRYVLGWEPEAALLALATDAHRRCEVSYYLGVRALAERRYAEASDWFRVTVETPGTEDWEWTYAKDHLYRWTDQHRALPIAVRKVAAARLP